MVLLDAYGLISFVCGGPAERQVRGLLDQGDVAMSTVNLTEVLDITSRVVAVPESEVERIATSLLGGSIEVKDFRLDEARRAAAIRVDHYHRSSCPISLADCALLASAEPGDSIATADQHVLRIAGELGFELSPLPAGG